METVIALDTHAVVWLHAGEIRLFPPPLQSLLDASPLIVCPMVILELEYLREINRLTVSADQILTDLTAELALRVCDHPFPAIIRTALAQTWTRDPFDRIIVAHSLATGTQLVTKDETIHAHCPTAIWD